MLAVFVDNSDLVHVQSSGRCVFGEGQLVKNPKSLGDALIGCLGVP